MRHSSSQSGSVFFIIILAIAMFAGLSYAVFKGGAGSGAQLTNDQARLAAQEIIAYGDSVAKTFQTLKLRGCSNTQFDFSSTVFTFHSGTPLYLPNHNLLAPATGCNLFNDGKLIPVILPSNYMFDWTTITSANTALGHARIISLRVPGVGNSDQEEIILTYPAIKLAVCRSINDQLGIANPGNGIPTITMSSTINPYNGNFGDTEIITDPSGAITGKTSFCARSTASGENVRYMRVLLTR